LEYKEWIIIAAFYSGLHYLEAALTQYPAIQHSETSMPQGFHGSLHDYREDLIFQHFTGAWHAYRRLRNASIIARYLSTDRRRFLGQPVEDYFSDDDALSFVHSHLATVRQEVGF